MGRLIFIVALAAGCGPGDFAPLLSDSDNGTQDTTTLAPRPFRSIDGKGNHPANDKLGAANTPLRRIMPSAYWDGESEMNGQDRPSPRELSNTICAQDGPMPNPLGASDFLWQWGQFIDHDIGLSDQITSGEIAIEPPEDDGFFSQAFAFFRSKAALGKPREQP